MSTLDKLTELMDSLPENSVTRVNLRAVRAALLAGEDEEWRLLRVLGGFCVEGIAKLTQCRCGPGEACPQCDPGG